MRTLISTFHDLKNEFCSFYSIPDEKFSPLLLAAKHGDKEQLTSLLEHASDINHPSIQDALCLAAMSGHGTIVDLMIQKGVSPHPVKKYDCLRDAYEEELTPMGHAIKNKHYQVVEVLLKHGVPVDNVSRDDHDPVSALDLFFCEHNSTPNNPEMLRLLLSSGAKVHSLRADRIYDTLFKIAVYANSEEFNLLLNAGFDPNSVEQKESPPECLKTSIFYRREVSMLDLSVMQAEKASLFKEDPDSIKKIALLLEKGADSLSCRNIFSQNYLHQVSHPTLIQLFGKYGVPVAAKAQFKEFLESSISPIEAAHTPEAIEALCSLGESKENSPFLKGTKAHSQALSRIGFDPQKQLPLDEKGELLLMKAVAKSDLSAFVALIGEGVDVNQTKVAAGGWTCLHNLFSKISSGSVSPEYDYTAIATEDFQVKLINILIKHGAKPLKDSAGRTPLMCLNFNPFNTQYNYQIIDMYINFEAAYYHLDPKEYKEKFFRLRTGGFSSNGALSVEPMKSVFDQFWESFETHSSFDPPESHNPTAEWNALRSLIG